MYLDGHITLNVQKTFLRCPKPYKNVLQTFSLGCGSIMIRHKLMSLRMKGKQTLITGYKFSSKKLNFALVKGIKRKTNSLNFIRSNCSRQVTLSFISEESISIIPCIFNIARKFELL